MSATVQKFLASLEARAAACRWRVEVVDIPFDGTSGGLIGGDDPGKSLDAMATQRSGRSGERLVWQTSPSPCRSETPDSFLAVPESVHVEHGRTGETWDVSIDGLTLQTVPCYRGSESLQNPLKARMVEHG